LKVQFKRGHCFIWEKIKKRLFLKGGGDKWSIQKGGKKKKMGFVWNSRPRKRKIGCPARKISAEKGQRRGLEIGSRARKGEKGPQRKKFSILGARTANGANGKKSGFTMTLMVCKGGPTNWGKDTVVHYDKSHTWVPLTTA